MQYIAFATAVIVMCCSLVAILASAFCLIWWPDDLFVKIIATAILTAIIAWVVAGVTEA